MKVAPPAKLTPTIYPLSECASVITTVCMLHFILNFTHRRARTRSHTSDLDDLGRYFFHDANLVASGAPPAAWALIAGLLIALTLLTRRGGGTQEGHRQQNENHRTCSFHPCSYLGGKCVETSAAPAYIISRTPRARATAGARVASAHNSCWPETETAS